MEARDLLGDLDWFEQELQASVHSFQYGSNIWVHYNGVKDHFHLLDSLCSVDALTDVAHHIGNQVVEAQGQLEPLDLFAKVIA